MVHPDNKDWVIEELMGDIRALLVYSNRILQHVKNDKITLDREIAIDCLRSAVTYIADKWDMNKVIKKEE